MTTSVTHQCPACGAIVNYEGHEDMKKRTLVRHRFHCHRCGKVYIVQSTQHKLPKFPLKASHEIIIPAGMDAHGNPTEGGEQAHDHDHDHEGHDHEGHDHGDEQKEEASR